jgi:formylglycine-generating enzyme required for sulfatase activity
VVAHGQELMACDDLGGTMALVPGVEGESAPFLADRSEATVVQYTSCELAQGCTPTPNDAGCNAAAGSRDRHPVNCVSQAQARAYCAWQHKRLCTQDEFQRLGGGPQGYARPWGEMPATCELAVVAGPSPGCGKGGTWPVGARPRGASPVGCLDAVGNVSEWTEQGLMGGSWASPSGEVGLSSVGSGVGPTAGIRCCRDL